MKTIYLKQKRSGNFELTNKKNSTHKFNTKKNALSFWNENMKGYSAKKIIKATYRKSQTYFSTVEELLNFIK